MNKRVNISVTIVTLLFCLLAPMSSLAAPLQTWESSMFLQSGEGPTDPAELETFMDQVMQTQMTEYNVAGAVVSVVQDGEVLLAEGYGLADVAANKPADPETTLFAIGSITKVFTHLAVMQLFEQGKLDLNTDINTYLDFKIPATYSEPITLAHLMSHSSGLDEIFWGSCAPSPEKIIPLGEFLRSHMPARVRPPGVVSAYSNYGIALVGYIVERVSDQPYADYIEEHILQPLGMTRTTSRATLLESLSQDMALPYVYLDGSFQLDNEAMLYCHGTPAGSIKSTAVDMAHFMIAHLQGGTYQNAQILKPETIQLMQTQDFASDPLVLGWAHGFEVYRAENPRVIGHGGATDNFFANMWLIPESRLGIFVANNTASGRPMRDHVVEAFVDHYFPPPPVTIPAMLVGSTTDLHALEGSYASANNSFSSSEKVRLVMGIVTIQAQDDGSLVLSSLAGSQRYVEVEPMLFQRDDGKRVDYFDHFTFRFVSDGKVQYLLCDEIAFQKLRWYESMGFNLLFAAIVVLLFLSIPIAAIVWRVSPRLREQASKQPRAARLARWLMGLLVVLFFLSQFGLFSAFATQDAYLQGAAYANKVGGWLAIPISLLAVGAMIYTILAWKRGYWSVGWRIHYTLVTLAAMAQVWWYFNWKIIG